MNLLRLHNLELVGRIQVIFAAVIGNSIPTLFHRDYGIDFSMREIERLGFPHPPRLETGYYWNCIPFFRSSSRSVSLKRCLQTNDLQQKPGLMDLFNYACCADYSDKRYF